MLSSSTKKLLIISCTLLSSYAFSGCNTSIEIGSDGTIYSKGNESFRHGLTQTDQSMSQTTRIQGISITSHRISLGGINQNSTGNYSNNLKLNILPDGSYYEPCKQYPEAFKK